MKVNRKLGIEYGVACIGTKLFDFSGDGESSVSVFVKCLFSFERGSLYEWQDFIVRQKITTCTIFLHVYLPQDTSLRTGSEPLGLSLVPPTWLGRLDSNSEIVNMSKAFSSEPNVPIFGYKDGYKLKPYCSPKQ